MSIPQRYLPTAAEVHAERERSGRGMMEIKREYILQAVESDLHGLNADPRVVDILRTLLAVAKREL